MWIFQNFKNTNRGRLAFSRKMLNTLNKNKSRGGEAVSRKAHNLEAAVQIGPPQHDKKRERKKRRTVLRFCACF
ncbi:MAG: hypothetical protein CO014_00090 [Candidatus Tagabacteria bacterium CG_4_8_14_3_um_filter_41_8]|uniref:Uncharacterized protein n=2 Tax=Candidatus Tagaibacteriota TaxID=1817918 RepID=A0A2M8GA30_9BACT|nr:MAG: hypothetical protein COS58_01645 [Candidatus Tagabacteria bacterium CG03_land_8_20_14_0_80_41_22]PJC70194.1 MAG: hypothetical protein CO014_00090 [Candidatus Tagabacteria bacterium CG_4_8_14_3_um_filter_41_8]